MDVQPAHINQVISSRGGGLVEISADVGHVADDLRRIDPTLRVRFAPDAREPFFAVYCQPDERSTYLVLTVAATQNRSGTWEGLDQRVVREFERIGADGYDYAGEVERQNRAAAKAKADRISVALERAGADGWALLNKLRGRNCGFMSVPGAVPPTV
jgi:hypothetical protein